MKSYLSPAGFKIFAHRGSTEGGAVENTLEAFHYAIEAGVTYLETDVQATKDGVAVLFHDSKLTRIAGVSKQVSDYTLEELRSLKLVGGGRIPTLQEALERFPKAKFNLDLKTADSINPAVSVIKETSALDRVLVSSFSRARRVRAIKQLALVATSGDMVTVLFSWLSSKLQWQSMTKLVLSGISALQIPPKASLLRFDSARFIASVKAAGVELHYWTINDYDEALRLKALGADGIVTDHSKMMVERFREAK